MTSIPVSVQSVDERAVQLIQELQTIRSRLESEGHESLKKFVDVIEEANVLSEQSERALDEVLADMDMTEADTPPSSAQ